MNYGASGWVAHQVSDIWAKTSPDRGEAVWALWPMGGAWLCTHVWEHYTYTMDKVKVLNFLISNRFFNRYYVSAFTFDSFIGISWKEGISIVGRMYVVSFGLADQR